MPARTASIFFASIVLGFLTYLAFGSHININGSFEILLIVLCVTVIHDLATKYLKCSTSPKISYSNIHDNPPT